MLDKHAPPLGIVFASFMTANVVGSRLYSLALDKVTAKDLLIGKYLWFRKDVFSFFVLVSSIIGAVSTLTLTWTSHPDSNFPYFSFLSLTLFQLAVGIYNAGLFCTDKVECVFSLIVISIQYRLYCPM